MRERRVLAVAALVASAALLEGCCTCARTGADPPDYVVASFEIQGDLALMTGVIDHTTPDRVLELVTAHPEVSTIVMVDVPGSDDDPANLRAARMVRAHGLSTEVRSDGIVASGGVDFFIAGVERSVRDCARLGVHDWEDEDVNGVTVRGDDLPLDHEMHTMFLEYYRDMGVPEAFYWFTLEAAPPERIHWMTEAEMEYFGLTTGDEA